MSKLYMSPPVWLVIGVLTGWVHVKPGLVISLVWGAALYGMVIWIMRDVKTRPSPEEGEPSP